MTFFIYVTPLLPLDWAVTVAMVTGEEYRLDSRCMFIQYSKHNSKLLCERDISRLTPVKKMWLSIQKTDSVNVAYVSQGQSGVMGLNQ